MDRRISSCMCGQRDTNTVICYTSTELLANLPAFNAELIITHAAHTSHQTKQTHLHAKMAYWLTNTLTVWFHSCFQHRCTRLMHTPIMLFYLVLVSPSCRPHARPRGVNAGCVCPPPRWPLFRLWGDLQRGIFFRSPRKIWYTTYFFN